MLCTSLTSHVTFSFQADYIEKIVQDYEGPTQKVDLIILSHVIYHFSDRCKEELERIMSWLSPGGHLAVVLDKETKLHDSLSVFANRELAFY